MYTNRYGTGRPCTGCLRPYAVEAACRVCRVLSARSHEEAGAVEDCFPEAVFEIVSIREDE